MRNLKVTFCLAGLVALACVACGDSSPDSNDAAASDAGLAGDAQLPALDGAAQPLSCPSTDLPFDWPALQTIPFAPGPSWKDSIQAPLDPFMSRYSGTDGNEVRWMKFVVLLSDPTRVYFQNSALFPFHYDFATQQEGPFRGMSRAAFDAVALGGDGQQAVLGAVLFPPASRAAEVGIQLVGSAPYPSEMVRRLFALVVSKISAPAGTQFLYIPVPEQRPCVKAQGDWYTAHDVPWGSAERWVDGNACYSGGWAIGRLIEVPGSQIDAAYLDGRLAAADIL